MTPEQHRAVGQGYAVVQGLEGLAREVGTLTAAHLTVVLELYGTRLRDILRDLEASLPA